MKRLIFISLISLASCSVGKQDPTFDVSTTVKRHCYNDSQGIVIKVFPVDKEESAK